VVAPTDFDLDSLLLPWFGIVANQILAVVLGLQLPQLLLLISLDFAHFLS